MMFRYIWLLGLSFASYSFAASSLPLTTVKDLYHREALYDVYLGRYFEAITRLEVEFEQGYGMGEFNRYPTQLLPNAIRFTAGDAELSYRLTQQAELTINGAKENNIGQYELNEMLYRLARLYLQQDKPIKALSIINKITGMVPEKIRYDELFLRAQIYMANGQYENAVKILQSLQEAKNFEGFAAYNLGIALNKSGQEQQWLEQFDKTGQIISNNEATLAIKDKANLMLGYRLLESGQAEASRQYFDRVRLEGPFSNKALLGSGWVDASLGNFERALVPWTLLMKRNVTDKTVQESMLAVPYAYGKLGLFGKAARLYGGALEGFDLELAKLDSSIKSVRERKFLQTLVRDEYKRDRNWVVKLRELPDSPETYYLLELMASVEFQNALNNYLDLAELHNRLALWNEDIGAYKELIEVRRNHYKSILPDIDYQVQGLDTSNKLWQEQRRRADNLLKSMLETPQPDVLATFEERSLKKSLLDSLGAIDEKYKGSAREEVKQIRIRIKRLIGVMQWQIDSAYDQRLAVIQERFRQLDMDEENLEKLFESFSILRKVAIQSYEGYEDQIDRLETRVHDSQSKVKILMARQGHKLEEMAINELGLRRKRLEEYQVQAIFALAEVYEQASKKQNAGNKTQ